MDAVPREGRCTPPSTRALEAIARSGIFVFGIVMAIIGAVVPALLEPLALTLGDVGALFLVMNAGMLVSSLVLGLVVDRFGLKVPLAAGAALVAVALLLIARATGFVQLLAAAGCLGFGGGAVNGASNTLVADLHDDPRQRAAALNRLGVFFGFGALVLPFGIGAVSSTVGMGGLLAAAAALCTLTAIGAAMLRFPPPKQLQGWPLAHVFRFIRMPVVLMLAGLLFLQSGNEFLLGGYLATFLTRELGVSLGTASYALAGYWAGLMVTRIVLGYLLLRVAGTTVILASAVLSAGTSMWLGLAGGPSMGIAGAALAGVAIAGIFPTVLSVAAGRFPTHSGTIFGILLTVALSGGMTIPWAGGRLADAVGVRIVFVLAAANFLGIAILIAGVRRALDRSPMLPLERAG